MTFRFVFLGSILLSLQAQTGVQYKTAYEPHFARGGGWSTTVYITTAGKVSGECTPYSATKVQLGPSSSIQANAPIILGQYQTTVTKVTFASTASTLDVGYVTCRFPITYDTNTGKLEGAFSDMYSIFTYTGPDGLTLEAASTSLLHVVKNAGTLNLSNSTSVTDQATNWSSGPNNFVFDSTGGYKTGLACLIRPDLVEGRDKTISFRMFETLLPEEYTTYYDIPIPAGSVYFALTLEDKFPQLLGKMGYLSFRRPSGTIYTCVAFRFSPSGNFTNIPAF